MKSETWTVVKKGNGKFSPKYSNGIYAPFWPFPTSKEFDTLEEAKNCLLETKTELEKERLKLKETVVFELK